MQHSGATPSRSAAELVGLRVGLTCRHLVCADQHVRERQADRLDAAEGKRAAAGGHDRPRTAPRDLDAGRGPGLRQHTATPFIS